MDASLFAGSRTARGARDEPWGLGKREHAERAVHRLGGVRRVDNRIVARGNGGEP